MVNLERTLAEIEVLAKELQERFTSSYSNSQKAFTSNRTLTGMAEDAELVYKKCLETYRLLNKKDIPSASSAFTEMALDSKNLAENLSIFIQTIYGENRPTLKSLQLNISQAPKTSDGKTLYEVFTGTHDSTRASLIKLARDSKGHGNGHTILLKTPSESELSKEKPYYVVFNDERTLEKRTEYLPKEFISTQAQSYLEMTRTILQTIADKDTQHFVPRKSNRELRVLKQRAKNFYSRHSRPIAITLASTLLTAGVVGGSVGTIAYQNYQKQIEMQKILTKVDYISDVDGKFRSSYDMWELGLVEDTRKGLIEKRKLQLQTSLIAHPEFCSNYNLENVFGTGPNLFETVSGGLEVKSTQLGIYVDNYISRASVNPTNVIGKTKEFLDRRTKFRKELKSFSEETRGKVPTYAALENLNGLFKEEKDLESLESSIIIGLQHGQLR